MCKIVLPIHKKYSQGILENKKIFELRRSIPKREVKEILIYETAPTSRIVGLAKVKRTHQMKIDKLWKLTNHSNLITKKEFFEYFKNKEMGYAFEIQEVKRFAEALPLSTYNIKAAPQGFVYID